MDTTKVQNLLEELKSGPEPGESIDDTELPPDFPNPEEMIDDGADPQFVLYSTMQIQLLTMAAMLEDSGAVDVYHEMVEAGLETYMPGFPPMSPVTDSLFHSWALCDLKFGEDRDNIGQIAITMMSEMGMPAELNDLCRKLVSSRMGIYETLDISGDMLVLRELVTNRELLVDAPTGYLGEEGELRFVRLGPPAVPDAEYFTELTTPYILDDYSASDWTRYLQRVMPKSVTSSEGVNSTQIEDRLAAVFKDDLGAMPWLEFVFQGFSDSEEDVIYLTGIPDDPASLPNGEGTAATNSALGMSSELVRQAQALGISIIPPGANGHGISQGLEISLTDAQRQAATDLMPSHRPGFKPETKGRKRISLTIEQWEELSHLAERRLGVEHGHGKTRLRNLRKAIDSAIADAEMSRPRKGSAKHGASSVTQTIYRMRIDLRGAKPPIWRRIEVPDCTLAGLHVAVQAAMGWTDSHLHQFLINGDRYSVPNPFCDDDFGVADSADVWLSDVIHGKGAKIEYMYDFGDGWDHVIRIEAVEPAKTTIRYPRCVAGKRNCPVEDCGGIWGYKELLQILANPKHPEYEGRIDWCGEFDPEDFDVDSTTQHMQSWLAAVEQPSRQLTADHRRIQPDDDGSFDINDNFFGDDGEFDDAGFEVWRKHLQNEFVTSPEFKSLPEGDYGFVDCVINYAVNYLGEMPTTMSVVDLEEILFDIVPRKVMAEPEEAESIVQELNAFFRFIEREYAVENVRMLAEVLTTKAARRLKKELGNDSGFGMAKSFFAAGKASGFDMTTQDGLDKAMLAWNANRPNLNVEPELNGPEFDEDKTGLDKASTIRRDIPRIGRNDPCHCGSEKKYKKCCLHNDG